MSTPREQLARMIDPDTWAFTDRKLHIFPADHPACYQLREHSLEKADQIIAAGWTPPIHPEEEEEPFSRMSYEAMEAKLAQQESAPRIT